MADAVSYIVRVRDQFSRNMKKYDKLMHIANKRTEKLGRSLTLTGKKMKELGRSFSLRVSLPIIAGLALITKEASDAQETFSKFDVTFREVAKGANKSFLDLRNNFGLSSIEAKKLLSDTGDILIGFGFTSQAALDLSTKVQRLSVDLASFTNVEGGAVRVSQALTKGLLGERESLKLLGIAITEDIVKEKLRERGLHRLKGIALKRAKAEVTLQIAISQSKNAIGDFARTEGQLANQTRILLARFKDLRIALGTLLIPIVTKVVNRLVPMILQLTDWVNQNKELTFTILKVVAALAVIGPVLSILGNAVLLFNALRTAIIVTRVAMIAFSAVISLNPIVIAVTAIIGLLIILERKFKVITKTMQFLKSLSVLTSPGAGISTGGLDINNVKKNQITEENIARFKNSVDVSGSISVSASEGAKIDRSNSFNPNVGLNAQPAF